MNHLRVVLGLMMLGSALWLVSLLTIHIGRTPVLTLLVILAIALLVATALALPLADGATRGRSGHRGGGRRRLCRPTGRPGARAATGLTGSRSASRLSPAPSAEHKRVFIDVTADWCVTCKAQ